MSISAASQALRRPSDRVSSSSDTNIRAFDIARCAAFVADAKKANDIIVLDVSHLSDVTQALVICTGATARLSDSVVDAVVEQLRIKFGIEPFGIEGRTTKRWIVLDYGTVVVHIFIPEARDYYRLEHLWGDAPRLIDVATLTSEAEITAN